MTPHPNRSRTPGPASNPSPEQVRAAREAAGLTQTTAAELIFGARRTWADWEGGARKMPPAAWVMFLLRADLHPSAKLVPRVDMFDSADLLTSLF